MKSNDSLKIPMFALQFGKSEIVFLIFYLPLFILKMFGLGMESPVFVMSTGIGTILSVVLMNKITFRNREKAWLCILMIGVLSAFFSLKFSILFSMYSLICLRNIEYGRVKRTLFYIGIIAFTAVLVKYHNLYSVQDRFIGDEWNPIIKRPNFIFVDYFTLVNLHVLINKKKLGYRHLAFYVLGGVAVYRYTGSRTGILVLAIELFLLLFIKIFEKRLSKNNFLLRIAVYIPVLLFLGTLVLNYSYGIQSNTINKINLMLQHRLHWGKQFLTTYPITLLGQKMFFSFAQETYAVLDNAYLTLLLSYGLIITYLFLLLNVHTLRRLKNTNRYIEMAIIISYVFYGITESFIIVGFQNMSIFIYAEMIFEQFTFQESSIESSKQYIGEVSYER